MKKWLCRICAVIGLFSVFAFTACASCERELKSCKSDMNGGLYRIVKVYNLNGEIMATYEGKIDLATEDGCVQFEYNGKRIIWYNAIVEIVEK